MIIPNPGHNLSLGDSLYRHYEAWLRQAENRTGCMVSADGALLALRRELFENVPAEVNDDFFISTCAPVAGKRIVYVEDAQVLDQGVDEPGKQYRRRLRVTVGGLQSLAQRRELMNPLRHGAYAIALISHKLIRRLAPVLLLPLLRLFRARLLPLLAHGRALAALRRRGGRRGNIAAGGHICNGGRRGRLIAG